MTEGSGRDTAGVIANIISSLLPIHAAISPEQVVDAASAAAERGLGAPFAFVFTEAEDGSLAYAPPASELRRKLHRRAADALGTVLFRATIDAKDLPMFGEAMDTGGALVAPLCELFSPLISNERSKSASMELGVETACVAGIENAGERLGVLVVFGAAAIEPSHVRLLADHVACALMNLRRGEAARLEPMVDFARSVFDARKVTAELERELIRASRYRRDVSICIVEATNLRLLREQFGPALTEQLLEKLGETLALHARDIDVIGSYKETGYAMVLTEASGAGVENAAARLSDAAAAGQIKGGAPGLELHLAIGHATFPEDGTTADALFAAAERRMYGGAATRVA